MMGKRKKERAKSREEKEVKKFGKCCSAGEKTAKRKAHGA